MSIAAVLHKAACLLHNYRSLPSWTDHNQFRLDLFCQTYGRTIFTVLYYDSVINHDTCEIRLVSSSNQLASERRRHDQSCVGELKVLTIEVRLLARVTWRKQSTDASGTSSNFILTATYDFSFSLFHYFTFSITKLRLQSAVCHIHHQLSFLFYLAHRHHS